MVSQLGHHYLLDEGGPHPGQALLHQSQSVLVFGKKGEVLGNDEVDLGKVGVFRGDLDELDEHMGGVLVQGESDWTLLKDELADHSLELRGVEVVQEHLQRVSSLGVLGNGQEV